MAFGRELRHVGGLPEAVDAGFLGFLQGRRRIRVLGDDVGTLGDQGFRGIGFLARVEPGVHPDDLDLEVRVDLLGAQHEGVDPGHDLGDREGRDIAHGVVLRRLGRDLAHDVATLVETGRIGREVGCLLVAGGVFERHFGKTLRHLQHRVHEAEGRAEDQLVATARQLFERPLGIVLGDVFEERGLDLVAELLLQELPALVVLVGIAEVADRPDIDEADLQLVGSPGGRRPHHDRHRQCRRGTDPLTHS